MAEELTPEREATIREGHALGRSQADIARELEVPQPIVSRWAKRIGLHWSISPNVQAMNDKVRERIALRRAELAEALLNDAIAIRERLWDSYELVVSTPTGPERLTLDIPDAKAASDLTAAVDRLLKSHENLTRMGAGQSANQVASVLAQMQAGLEAFAQAYEKQQEAEEDGAAP